MKTLAIFGAGPGAGFSTARRFGRERFRIALVARNRIRLESFVDKLAAEGIEAAAFGADLGKGVERTTAVDAIEARFGQVDVAVINGFLRQEEIRPIAEVDAANLAAALDDQLHAPLDLAWRLLPGMRERGDGGLLFGLGASAKNPMPMLGAYGPAGAALRSYVLAAHETLAAQGVYLGALIVGGLVERSDPAKLFDPEAAVRHGIEIDRLDPDDLAERYWQLLAGRDRAELSIGALA